MSSSLETGLTCMLEGKQMNIGRVKGTPMINQQMKQPTRKRS